MPLLFTTLFASSTFGQDAGGSDGGGPVDPDAIENYPGLWIDVNVVGSLYQDVDRQFTISEDAQLVAAADNQRSSLL